MVSLTLGAGGTVAYTLRRRMKLYTTGWLMNYGLCLGGPAAIAGVLHESLQKQILFGKGNDLTLDMQTVCFLNNTLASPGALQLLFGQS